jgi:F420-non-reducing hydrogenase small subunit
MSNPAKPKFKIAVYWGAACGGCCVSVLDIHEALLMVMDAADIVFWPIAMDIKYDQVKKMPDSYIDITLYNGAIRNSENEIMAKLLRTKSKLMIAYGSCAHMGGIPGLANFFDRKGIFERVYIESESTDNESHSTPALEHKENGYTVDLPYFFNHVFPLDKYVCVDYYIPGCPPQSERLVEILTAIFTSTKLPSRKSVIGALEKSQCDECERKKSENKKIKRFLRPQEFVDDGETCFLEQGLICMGPATRGGCGCRCIKANAPCRGCYGPPADVSDPGAKMLSAIATMIDSNDPHEIERIVDQIVDPAGTFYRFSLPSALFRRTIL